jgi:putative ABC transport system permease protein
LVHWLAISLPGVRPHYRPELLCAMRGERVSIPLRMVYRRPMRSLLAALGLAVTLAATLVAVAVAEKGKRAALSELREIGANLLTVSAEPRRNRGGRARAADVVTTLTLADARDIAREIVGVNGVAAEYRAEVPVKAGALARQPRVAGVEPSYSHLREAPVVSGRFFDEADDLQGQRVAVLGGRIARDLFGARSPVGELIRISGINFTVIGTLSERGMGLDAFNEDEVVFVPLRTARRRLFQVDYVQRLFVRVDDSADLEEVANAVVARLRERHHAPTGEPLDFRVQDQRQLVTIRETTVQQLSAFQVEVMVALLGAAALGVFALQFLSVRERRAEIGTRRALGASRPMIFLQFLMEGAMVCLSGATVGLALALVGTLTARAAFSPGLALIGFSACCGAGVLAAVAPARLAAGVHPAVALRAQ